MKISIPVSHALSPPRPVTVTPRVPDFVADALRVVGKRPTTLRNALRIILGMKKPQRTVFVDYLTQARMPNDAAEALLQLAKDLKNDSSKDGRRVARFAIQMLGEHYLAEAKAKYEAMNGKAKMR